MLREVARYDSLLKCKQHLQKRVAGRPTQSLWLHCKPGLGALAAPEALGKSEDCREFAAGSNVETELEREVKAALGKRLWSLQAELGNHPAAASAGRQWVVSKIYRPHCFNSKLVEDWSMIEIVITQSCLGYFEFKGVFTVLRISFD